MRLRSARLDQTLLLKGGFLLGCLLFVSCVHCRLSIVVRACLSVSFHFLLQRPGGLSARHLESLLNDSLRLSHICSSVIVSHAPIRLLKEDFLFSLFKLNLKCLLDILLGERSAASQNRMGLQVYVNIALGHAADLRIHKQKLFELVPRDLSCLSVILHKQDVSQHFDITHSTFSEVRSDPAPNFELNCGGGPVFQGIIFQRKIVLIIHGNTDS